MLTAVLYERIEISGGQKKKEKQKSPSDNGLHYRHFNEVKKKKKEGESSPEFKKKKLFYSQLSKALFFSACSPSF